jgi:hypothetical protein
MSQYVVVTLSRSSSLLFRVYNSLNPQWTTVIFLDGYKFGVPLFIEVGVFDFDAKSVGQSEKGLALESSETGRLITSANIKGARDKYLVREAMWHRNRCRLVVRSMRL